jgi:hypothetical protein
VPAKTGLVYEAKARPRAEAATETHTFPKVSAKTQTAAETGPAAETETDV